MSNILDTGPWIITVQPVKKGRVCMIMEMEMIDTVFRVHMSSKEAKDLAALLTQTGENNDSDAI